MKTLKFFKISGVIMLCIMNILFIYKTGTSEKLSTSIMYACLYLASFIAILTALNVISKTWDK